ncbi:MAG: amidase, partial [Pseudomonadota bacterium]
SSAWPILNKSKPKPPKQDPPPPAADKKEGESTKEGEAAKAEAEIAAGLHRGPLHGVPFAVKDLCRTHDAPTAAGMKLHEGYMAGYDSTVVARLRQAGAVILGKLAMTEGAFANHHPDMPTPVNPFAPNLWAGASSSGSGSATAAGLCFGSLGSDTGGSIRFPSHANGLTGLKATWGRVSRHGVFALADSLDHVGPMARTAADCAAILAAIAGPDGYDPTALAAPVDDYLAACGAPISGLRIGLDPAVVATLDPQIAAAIEAAAAAFESLGARIAPMTMPDAGGLMDAWSAICGIECLIAHRETWPARRDEYGPGLVAVLEGAQDIPAMAVGDAMQRRLAYCGAWETAVQDIDMVLMPILAKPTPDRVAWEAFKNGDEGGLTIEELLTHTAPADMTGHPALTLPAGVDDRGGPIGVQLIGAKLAEAQLFSVGHAFQTVTDWHIRRPDLSALPA